MNVISDYEARKRDEEWNAREDKRLERVAGPTPAEVRRILLWCRACGAKYSQDCTCTRFEIPLAEHTEEQ